MSKLIHMKFILFIEGIGNLTCALTLYFFSYDKAMLWVFACLSGIFIGPCHPSVVAWSNRYMVLTATGVGILSVALGSSDLMVLPGVGSTIDSCGISVMILFGLGFAAASCALPFAMQGVACTSGDRFNTKKEMDSTLEPLLPKSSDQPDLQSTKLNHSNTQNPERESGQ